MKNTLLGVSLALVLAGSAVAALASFTYSQTITLEPGWSTISTPRVLDSHAFSVAQISTNFDIYVLDASQPSGWATMAAIGQTEFKPLYGYFINNKTGSTQTLTLHYKDGLTPSQRLFSRSISSVGWNSIGVANPTYSIRQCEDATNTDNADNILFSLNGQIGAAVDFTTGEYATNPSSVFVSDTWTNATPGNLNTLNDLRDTKGYAVYITSAASYVGSQDQDDPNGCSVPLPPGDVELNLDEASDNPESRVVDVDDTNVTGSVVLLTANMESSGDDAVIKEITVHITTSVASLDSVVAYLHLEIDGDITQTIDPAVDCSAGTCVFDSTDTTIAAGDSVKIRVLVDINGTIYYPEGSTMAASIDNSETVAENTNGDAADVGNLTGSLTGNEAAFYDKGIQVAFESASESKVTDDSGPDIGTFVIKFKVTAFDTDAFIHGDCEEDLSIPTPPTGAGQGIVYGIDEGQASGANASSSCVISNTDETPNGNFEVNDGETHTFTLTVVAQGYEGFVSVFLESINWDITDVVTPTHFYVFNLNEFKTDSLYLQDTEPAPEPGPEEPLG